MLLWRREHTATRSSQVFRVEDLRIESGPAGWSQKRVQQKSAPRNCAKFLYRSQRSHLLVSTMRRHCRRRLYNIVSFCSEWLSYYKVIINVQLQVVSGRLATPAHPLLLQCSVTCADGLVAPGLDCFHTKEYICDQKSVVSTSQSIFTGCNQNKAYRCRCWHIMPLRSTLEWVPTVAIYCILCGRPLSFPLERSKASNAGAL